MFIHSLQLFVVSHNVLVSFIEAKCDETALTEAIDQIEITLKDLQITLTNITTAKTSLRKVLDCHANRPQRDELFDYYGTLCQRAVIIGNVHQDLAIKKTILEKEKERCINRSKLTSKSSLSGFGIIKNKTGFSKSTFMKSPHVNMFVPLKHWMLSIL